MRVLQVVDDLPDATDDGPALYTQWLSEALAAKHEVAIATPGGSDAEVRGVSIHSLPDTGGWIDDTGHPSGLERDPVDPIVADAFVDVLSSVDPDVVHVQHLRRTSASLPDLCRERDVPVVLTLHDAWMACHRTDLQRPDGKHCAGPESVEKCTACYADALERTACRDGVDGDGAAAESVHESSGSEDGDPPEPSPVEDDSGRDADSSTDEDAAREAASRGDMEAQDDASRADSSARDEPSRGTRPDFDLDLVGRPDVSLDDLGSVVTRRTERLQSALDAASLLLAPSWSLRNEFLDAGVPDERMLHCRPGVPLERYDDTGFDPEASRTFGYVGRLSPDRGVHELVEAFRTVDGDARLDLFGAFDPEADDYHARLRDAAAGERITFYGRRGDDPSPFEAMDVLVVPSSGFEHDPLVIQEALAAGVPVITTEGGGTAELVDHCHNGLAVPAGDPVALAECLQTLIDEPDLVAGLRSGVGSPKSMADHVRQVAFLYDVCASGDVSTAVDEIDLPS